MRAALRGLGWALIALGFMAVGADLYWSAKAQAFSFESGAGYLARAGLPPQAWLAGAGDGLARAAMVALSWPVWPFAFFLGGLLLSAPRPRD